MISRITSSYSRQSSSSGGMSGGKIAAIVVGTIVAVGVVCLLIFGPRFVFAERGSRKRTSGRGKGEVKKVRSGRASGNDRNGKGADDAGSRRRRPEADGRGGSAQRRCNRIVTSRGPGSPIVINNNIYIDPNDYPHPLPAPNPPPNRGPAAPVIATTQRTAQAASAVRNVQLSPPPNRNIPPQRRRRRRGESPARPSVRAPISAHTAAEAPRFWDVADWARRVAPRQAPRPPTPTGSAAGSYVRERARNPARRRGEGSSTRVRAFGVPRAFPEDGDDVGGRFQLVTAPARARAPRAPSRGDDGFWVREARESRWERQEWEDRRERREREDRRERDRYDREERRERDKLEREERRDRQEREERRERQERGERRERQDGLRRWRDV